MTRLREVIVTTGLLWSTAFAFECTAARGDVERAICANRATKAADDAMNEAFERIKTILPAEQGHALVVNQRRWLKARMDSEAAWLGTPDCSDRGTALSRCLRDMDVVRTRQLEAKAIAGPGIDGLQPFLVEKPKTKTTYEVGMFLYKAPHPVTRAKTAVNRDMDRFVQIAPDKRDADAPPVEDYLFHAVASIAYASPRLLSIEVTTIEWAGGPHPSDDRRTFNIDAETGRDLAYDDLVDGRNKRKVLQACKAEVDADDRDASADALAVNDLRDDVENLAHWTFTADHAEIFLGRLRGYALGDYSCDLTYASLRPLAKNGFPLPR